MAWIPITAAGIINGAAHYWGYRNFEAHDASANISPWGILIGGEELHNNHHTYPTSAKLSVKPYEFDIGWLYISILQFFGLELKFLTSFNVNICVPCTTLLNKVIIFHCSQSIGFIFAWENII
jgi:fatty-acid desaturase